MTQSELDQIRAYAEECERLEAAATKGPVEYHYSPDCLEPHAVFTKRTPAKGAKAIVGSVWAHDGAKRDMHFIAHCFNHPSSPIIKRLLGEIERLQKAFAESIERRTRGNRNAIS